MRLEARSHSGYPGSGEDTKEGGAHLREEMRGCQRYMWGLQVIKRLPGGRGRVLFSAIVRVPQQMGGGLQLTASETCSVVCSELHSRSVGA